MKLLFKILIGAGIVVCIVLLITLAIGETHSLILKAIGFASPNLQSNEQIKFFIESFPSIVYLSVLIVIIILLLLLYVYQDVFFRLINQIFKALHSSFVNLFSIISVKEYIVLLIPFISSIYFALTVPVSYDEAITYNLFTSKPFYYAAIFYPYPNNHVFHSLVTNFFEILPFGNTLFGMRIPVILANIFTWIIALSFFKKFYSSKIAILAIGCCTVFGMTIYYSFMSRGYALMVMCTVICFYVAFNIIKGGKKRDWFYYGFFSIIGAYTIPSFLYPLATINVILLVFKFKDIKKLILVNLAIGICVFLAYLPIILVDGIDTLTNNSFVQKVSRIDILQGIFYFYRSMINDIIGINFSFLWIIILLPILFVLKNKVKLIIWIILILAPFVLVFIQAVNPFYRTFLYYNFFIVFLFFTSSDKILKYIPIQFCYLVIVIQLFSVLHFGSTINEKESFNTDVNTVVTSFFKDDTSIIFPCTASANYTFEAKVRKMEDKIIFGNNEKASADSISGSQYVIIERSRDETKRLMPMYKSQNQNIYRIH